MEDGRRWSVTYTKHVKQKRKVYQDGFLELQSSRHKVMLYDEWDKLLESRFVKKDDVIKSGETLASDSYLVDIGELCGGRKPTSMVNSQEKGGNVLENSGSSLNYSSQGTPIFVDRKPLFGKSKGGPINLSSSAKPSRDRKLLFGSSKGRSINLSPSKKLIRDFRKSETNKCVSSPNCMDMAKTSTTEWQVLYTTQITQKAKKFHDGFLQLVVCGSQGRQVKLYDSNRRHLDSKFLKKDEIVRSGESLAFEGHLVEIGELEGDDKPVINLTLQGKNCEVVEKAVMVNHPAKIPTNKKSCAWKSPILNESSKSPILNESSFKVQNPKLGWRNLENGPTRAVHDILSTLRKPILRKVTMIKPLEDDCSELHSSDIHTDIEDRIKECADEYIGSAREELRVKASDHDSGIKVSKPEAVEVLVAAENCTSFENERNSQARSSSSSLGLETANCIASVPNMVCTNINKLMSNASPMEPHILATTALISEGQKPIESVTLTRSNKNGEPVNLPESCACAELMTETNCAATLSSGTLPKLGKVKESSSRSHEAGSSVGALTSNADTFNILSGVGVKTYKQNFYSWEMDEFPSFDLGI